MTVEQVVVKLKLPNPTPITAEIYQKLEEISAQQQISIQENVLRWYKTRTFFSTLEATQKVMVYHHKIFGMLNLGYTLPN